MTTLSFQDVTLKKRERVILEGVSGELRAGRVSALLGQNGAGKTSLLKALTGEERALTRGRIWYGERRLEELDALHLATRRAVLPQHSPLSFPLKVSDVVAMGRAAHHRLERYERDEGAWLKAALERVGLSEQGDRRYDVLSGGERQRVHLARVLAQLAPLDETLEGKWLFLDEPTASQDVAQAHGMLNLVSELASRWGLGVCLIIHDLNLALRYAEDAIVLRDGGVFAQGALEELFDEELFRGAFEVEARCVSSSQGERFVFIEGGALV